MWCPMEYEYLPDFCYTCGIIGHTDRSCAVQVAKGEVQQFSKKLRCTPERRRMEEGYGDRSSGGALFRHGGMVEEVKIP